MTRIGLIAGGGCLPIEFLRSAKEKGDEVVVYAFNGMAGEGLAEYACKIHWINIGQWTKIIFLMLKERTRRIAMVGKVDKKAIYEEETQDKTAKLVIGKFKNKTDYTILDGITRNLRKVGIEIIDTSPYLKHLIPEKGILTKKLPDDRVKKDIEFGYATAKKLAGMDIGQTVIVRNQNVIAVEAMEGTDNTIKRAFESVGEGCVMVKVSRPNQDMRWDVPTVGMQTIENLVINKYSALAIESGNMYLVQKEDVQKVADIEGIVVEVL